MGYWDYYRGTFRDYHRDPFPHSLLRTRECLDPKEPTFLGFLRLFEVLVFEFEGPGFSGLGGYGFFIQILKKEK